MPQSKIEELSKEMNWGPDMKWWQGKIAGWSLVRSGLTLPPKVTLMDQTIREGEDTPDVLFPTETKFKILEKLEEIGIKETEIGYVGAIEEQLEFARALKKRGTNLKLGSHQRGYTKGTEWKEELDRSIDAGVDIVNIVTWMSDPLIASTPWLKKEEVPGRIVQCVEYAKSRGVEVGLLVADQFRTRLDLLVNAYQSVSGLGIERAYVGDGTGNASPEAMAFMVKFVKDVIGHGTKIALHCHNEFGLALANSLAGIKAGAEISDVTVNGLGHNCGITALEELATCLTVLYGVDCGINMSRLYAVSKFIETESRMKLSPNKPVVGENIYRHQLDSHMATVIRGVWFGWDNIRPDVMGRSFRLEWVPGRLRTGRSGSVDAKIEQMGLEADDRQFGRIMAELKEEVNAKRIITETEVERIIRRNLR